MNNGILTDFLTPAELAGEMGVCTRTLDRWAVLGEGPPRVKVGRKILYRKCAVLNWLAEREHSAAA